MLVLCVEPSKRDLIYNNFEPACYINGLLRCLRQGVGAHFILGVDGLRNDTGVFNYVLYLAEPLLGHFNFCFRSMPMLILVPVHVIWDLNLW